MALADIDEPLNLIGAAVFWLYIVAALFLSAVAIYTIVNIQQPQEIDHAGTKRKQWLFIALTALSFTTLSFNMLHVLIQSFNAWSAKHRLKTYTNIVPLVRDWSLTSTLFRDFAEALLADDGRRTWTAATLLMTFGICLFIGIEGSRLRVPRLCAFFCLSQILPISFTQNLFYLTLLRLHRPLSPVSIRPVVLVALTGVYSVCLLALFTTTRAASLMPLIMLTRALLSAPYFVAQPAKYQDSKPGSNIAFGTRLVDWAAGVGVLMISSQLYLSPQHSIYTPATWILFSHPAVSALGCDFILSVASLIIWHTIGGAPIEHSGKTQKIS